MWDCREVTQRAGIYAIRNRTNGHQYIGSAKNFENRWWWHCYWLRRGEHENIYLQRSFNKYGEETFDFIILEYVEDPELLTPREQHYFDTLKPEYNSNLLAGRPPDATGRTRSEATRHRMSKAQKRAWTDERRRKESEARTGKTYEELYGPDCAAEVREKLSATHRGLNHTDKARRKMSESAKRAWSPERRQSQSEALRDKMYGERYGPEHAAQIRQRQSEAAKRDWARRRQQEQKTISL